MATRNTMMPIGTGNTTAPTHLKAFMILFMIFYAMSHRASGNFRFLRSVREVRPALRRRRLPRRALEFFGNILI